jgi:hypothetical protein
MRIHPVRVTILVAIAAAIYATYMPWLWIGGLFGVRGRNLAVWTGASSWLTEAGLQDGYATLVIAASVAPFVILGDRSVRLSLACRVYVLLAAFALGAFVALEITRLAHAHAENLARGYPWASDDAVGSGLYVLALAAFAMAASAAFPSPPRPYVDPAYRL